jgi:hypothetical protein
MFLSLDGGRKSGRSLSELRHFFSSPYGADTSGEETEAEKVALSSDALRPAGFPHSLGVQMVCNAVCPGPACFCPLQTPSLSKARFASLQVLGGEARLVSTWEMQHCHQSANSSFTDEKRRLGEVLQFD